MGWKIWGAFELLYVTHFSPPKKTFSFGLRSPWRLPWVVSTTRIHCSNVSSFRDSVCPFQEASTSRHRSSHRSPFKNSLKSTVKTRKNKAVATFPPPYGQVPLLPSTVPHPPGGGSGCCSTARWCAGGNPATVENFEVFKLGILKHSSLTCFFLWSVTHVLVGDTLKDSWRSCSKRFRCELGGSVKFGLRFLTLL